MSRQALHELRNRLTETVIGSSDAAELLLTALLARGHVLIEGAPGIGKTSLAHALASSMGGSFKRVQFTPDLLPADLLGSSLYRMDRGEFEFIPGPVFANCLLADEINRTSPRVQSALLECMNDGRVTLEGVTRDLPSPFLVIATRNDTYATGTFPLPEPQLDRFLLSVVMSLPDEEVQNRILMAHAEGRIPESHGEALVSLEEIRALQGEVGAVPVSQAVGEYITALCQGLRQLAGAEHSVSVRAALAVMQAARANAFLDEAAAVYPDHVQAVFAAVMRHRVIAEDGGDAALWIAEVLERTPVV
ncbi:MAG: AAA family ATPase [Verrucomicrobiales bacterium]